MINNLFNYATSELSQDAFICWLMSFSMENVKGNDEIKKCSQDFLKEFLEKYYKENDGQIIVEKIEKQYKSIDILLTVKAGKNKYKIIIEDKTYTSEHDNQLDRYKQCIIDEFNQEYIVVAVYYKTGYQSDLLEVKASNYNIIDRERILSILSKHIDNINNNIIKDYYEYYKNIEDAANKYKCLSIKDWDWLQINAFYDYIKNNRKDIALKSNFSYVPNQNGGFYAMWFYTGKYHYIKDIKCEIYLQFEFINNELKLCLKISVNNCNLPYKDIRENAIFRKDENGNWKKEGDKWSERLNDYNFVKPSRYGTGKTMTIGEYNKKPTKFGEAESYLDDAINDYNKLISEFKEVE